MATAAISVAVFSSAAQAQDQTINYGQLAVTGYSGSLAATPPDGADPFDYLGINLDGPSARVIDVRVLGPQGQISNPAKPFAVTASQVGQVFGVTMDNAQRPNIYLAATSNYGLAISVADPSGQPKRVRKGEAGAQWMAGQFGPPALGGGPGSIWKIDGTTGTVSLFANIPAAANGAASLGGLAFDARTNQIFAVDRGTGIVHRFGLDGTQRGTYDHGTEGRGPVGLPPIPAPPAAAFSIASPAFDTENPATWGFATPARRVYALAVRDNRLYYSVAQGPQVWSVGISPSGAVAASPRVEVEVPSIQEGVEIASITFDGQGRMYLAERGATTGDYFRYNFANGGGSRVLRYVRQLPGDPAPGLWQLTPQVYSIGLLNPYANANGGVALHYGYNQDNVIDFNACQMTVWSTGENLLNPGDPSLDPTSFLNVDGVQGNSQSLVQPQNSPPQQSWFVDYDDQNGDPNFHGHMGAVAALPCPGQPAVQPLPPPPPPPPVSCPPGTYFSNGQCLIIPTCPPGTYFQNGQCIYIDCPPGFYYDNGQCKPPPVWCPPGTFYYDGQCYPIDCPPGMIKQPNGVCKCPPGNIFFNGQCVPPQNCPPGMVELPGGICWCPLGTIFGNGVCNPSDCPPGQIMKNGFCQFCPPGEEVWNDKCVPKCPPGQVHKGPNGICQPPGCPPNQDFWQGKCVPKCPPGQVHFGPNGVCIPTPLCQPGMEWWNGQCVPICPPGWVHKPPNGICGPGGLIPPAICPPGQEKWKNQCVPKCPPGQFHQEPDGHCDANEGIPCPPDQELWNGQCVPKCPPGQIHFGPNGACGPGGFLPPGACPPGQEKWKDQCVPKCPPGQIHKEPDGQCGADIAIPCPNGQELWNGKCVPKCPSGQVHFGPNGTCIGLPGDLKLPGLGDQGPQGPQGPGGVIPPGPACLPPMEMVDGKCVQPCPPLQTRNNEGECVMIKMPDLKLPGLGQPQLPPPPEPPTAQPPPPTEPPSTQPPPRLPPTINPQVIPGLQNILPGITKQPKAPTQPSTPPPEPPPQTATPPQRVPPPANPPAIQVNPQILKNLPGVLQQLKKNNTNNNGDSSSNSGNGSKPPQQTQEAPQRTTPQTTEPQTTTPATPQLKILPQLFGIQPQQQQVK